MAHSTLVLKVWDRLLSIANEDVTQNVIVDGTSLDLAAIVAVARYGTPVTLSNLTHDSIKRSSELLEAALARGECLYGINTGFGGSADVRSDDVKNLQRTIVRQLHYGIISTQPSGRGLHKVPFLDNDTHANGSHSPSDGKMPFLQRNRPNEDRFAVTSMPESWIRAAMLIRSNSLSTGNSGVTLEIVQNIVDLLSKDVIPLMPLRGSISASGDLSPLSYLAGLVQGNPSLRAWVGVHGQDRQPMPADKALQAIKMSPRDLGPKEGLAITNGTSVSAGVAALALHDAHHLAILAQFLTAMGVEALIGNAESFDQFIADVRPHPGQVDCCRNIRRFLDGSRLLTSHSAVVEGGLMRQDRYALRTSTQWMGPQLEDLCLAHSQILIECNSTTDNPLIDTTAGKVLHGGNFQAQSITSAVEKIRLSAQRIGRMLFAQSTEIVNPLLNNGLPPNLVADEPSRSFLMKGVDIATAAYMSELGFLANPVGSHVQNAELGNQSINSLALISGRYTHTALDVLSQLSAAYLFSLCQALDLRALQARFFETFFPSFRVSITARLGPFVAKKQSIDVLMCLLWSHFLQEFRKTTSMDSGPAFRVIFTRLTGVMASCDKLEEDPQLLAAIKVWADECCEHALCLFLEGREAYAQNPDATPLLGKASTRLYKFVRHHLRIPFIKHDNVDESNQDHFNEAFGCVGTTGSMITTIYDAIRSRELYVPVMDCLRESMLEDGGT